MCVSNQGVWLTVEWTLKAWRRWAKPGSEEVAGGPDFVIDSGTLVLGAATVIGH